MTNERSYPWKPGDDEPVPPVSPDGSTPTVDISSVLETQRLSTQPVLPPDQTVHLRGPQPPTDQTQRLSGRPAPPDQTVHLRGPQVPPDQTQRLPGQPVYPSAQTQRLSDQPAFPVEQTQQLPVRGPQPPTDQTQRLPDRPGRLNQPGTPGSTPDQTQRIPGRGQQFSTDQTQRLTGPPGQPAFPVNQSQQSTDQTQRLPYAGQAGPGTGPVRQQPDQTLPYLTQGQGQGQGQPQAQYQPQYQARYQAQSPSGGMGTPTPTLRFGAVGDTQSTDETKALAPGEYRHFGPGVPVPVGGAPSQAAAVWRGESDGSKAPRKRRRALAGWLLAILVLLVVLAVLAWFRFFGPPVSVTGATVHPPTSALTCGQTANVTGTITTNGDAGTVTYQWKRSDGTESDVLQQHFAKGSHSANVVLLWTFSGAGSTQATATLDILTPNTVTASGSFQYTCKE